LEAHHEGARAHATDQDVRVVGELVQQNNEGTPAGEDSLSGLPPVTELIHNPTRDQRDDRVGFPEDSELLERHGKHLHLVEGDKHIALEVMHFVKQPVHDHPEFVEDRTLYVFPDSTSLVEARRIGYELLEKASRRGLVGLTVQEAGALAIRQTFRTRRVMTPRIRSG
jgi:hypothetical protein